MIKVFRNANLVIIGLVILVILTPAQKPAPATANSKEESQTRTRRAATHTEIPASNSEKPASKPARVEAREESSRGGSAPAAGSGGSASEPVGKSAETTAGQPTEPVNVAPVEVDPIIALRNQIDAAGTAAEKASLQMKLVELLFAGGDREQALLELRRMSADDRFDPQGFYNIGNAMARLGDAGGAIAAYRKAIDQRKGRYSRALNNLGVILMRQGQWDEAQDALLKALRTENFRYAEASYNLGRLYASRGEHDLAVREWRRAIAVNPQHIAAAQAVAGSAPEGRIRVDRVARRGDKTPDPYLRSEPIASSATRSLKVPWPVSSNKSLSVDAETYSFLQRARNARERDLDEEAIVNYRRVITRMGGYFAPANLELSYSLINSKRLEEAMATLLPVSERDGQRYPISYYHLARLYEARGELKLAEENFSRAATLYRLDNAQFLLDVSRVREKLGDFQGALAVFEEYLAAADNRNVRVEGAAERLETLKQKVAPAEPK